MHLCKTCNAEKAASDFSDSGAKKRQCRECTRLYNQAYYAQNRSRSDARAAEWAQDHPEQRRVHQRRYRKSNADRVALASLRHHLSKEYGLTVEGYESAVSSVGGACEICGEACRTGGRLSVDHAHATGDLRGLLCRACNSGLGHFRDDVALLKKAITYLKNGGVFTIKEFVA
jgi:hypothetical protein